MGVVTRLRKTDVIGVGHHMRQHQILMVLVLDVHVVLDQPVLYVQFTHTRLLILGVPNATLRYDETT